MAELLRFLLMIPRKNLPPDIVGLVATFVGTAITLFLRCGLGNVDLHAPLHFLGDLGDGVFLCA